MNYIHTQILKYTFFISIIFILFTAVAFAQSDRLEPSAISVEPVVYDGGEVVACTADAKMCEDGSYVGRTGPECKFVCPEDGDGIKDDDEDTQTTSADVFIKIDDIKGEASDDTEGGDPDRPVTAGDVPNEDEKSVIQRNQTDLEFLNTRDKAISNEVEDESSDAGDSDNTVKKPKEIVVVGSKIREAIAEGVEVRGWDTVSKEVILKTEDVVTEEDLTDYATALLASSEDISSISVRDDVVGLTFDQPVRLFGLFEVAMEHRVDVSSSPDEVGRVKVRFPWWSFLAKKDISADEIKTTVESELERNNVEEDNADTAEVQQEPRQFQTLGNTMKVLHDTMMAVIRKIG